MEAAEEIRKIAVARLRGGGLEGTAKRGSDAGMRGRSVDPDDLAVHRVQIRYCSVFVLQLHVS